MENVVRYTGENFSRGWMEYLKSQPEVIEMWVECVDGKWAICAKYGVCDVSKD